MRITAEQRQFWTQNTANSPFNRWLADETRGPDGGFELERLYALAARYGVDKRSEYEALNPGQQRMNLGNILRRRVPAADYAQYLTEAPASLPQVFGTRFWGFDPATHPFVGFTYEGSRAALIARARPGDLIAVVGTMDDPTAEEDRGKLLGLIEFVSTPVQAEDLLTEGQVIPDYLLKDGRFRWPYAVPAVKAWRIEPAVRVRDVIGRQLTMAATTSVDRLTDAEAAAVLNLSVVEVELPPNRVQIRNQRLKGSGAPRLDPSKQGQPGPPPSEWSSLTARSDGPTATYLMQFGGEDLWKIGISQNLGQRRDALNFSVPSEILGGRCWNLVLFQTWCDGASAYQMEQALLTKLAAFGTANERLQAPRAVIDRAWQDYMMGRL